MPSQQPQPSQASRTPARRRQRSTRLAVAVALLAVGAALVIGALASSSAGLTAIAAVVAERRTAESAAFAADMRRKISEREEAIDVLERALSNAQKNAAEQTLKHGQEARRADAAERGRDEAVSGRDDAEGRAAEAIVVVAELEAEIDVLRAELDSLRAAAARRDHRSA